MNLSCEVLNIDMSGMEPDRRRLVSLPLPVRLIVSMGVLRFPDWGGLL